MLHSRRGTSLLAATLLLSSFAVGTAHAQITVFTDRPTFDTAVGPTSLEDFGTNASFPIASGVLNSATNETPAFGPPILPGDIVAGVTFSRPVGTSFFFNIDSGGGFVGGFLDGFVQSPDTPLTITFDGPVNAFGFDTNTLTGSGLTVSINYGGTPFSQFFSVSGDSFFGFQSGNQDIASLTIINPNPTTGFTFALDNFAFTAIGTAAPAVPEPGSIALLTGMTLTGAAFLRRHKQARKAA